MATFVFTLPGATSGAAQSAGVPGAFASLFGNDIWLDLADGKGPNLIVTPAGDWKLAGGYDAYRQSLIRRFVANPGDWATKPGYGAGGKAMVKASTNSSNIDAFRERLRAQALSDKRTARVEYVNVERMPAGLIVNLRVIPTGDPKRVLPVNFGIPG